MKNYINTAFLEHRQNLNDTFGEQFVTENPSLIGFAVIADELAALRLEMTQLKIAIQDLNK